MPPLSRRSRTEAEAAEQLATYWDELTDAARASRSSPAPSLSGVIDRLRQLDARDERLNPDPAFAQRLASELFGQPASSPAATVAPAIALPQPPRQHGRLVALPRLPRPSRWLPAVELLAVAAILLLLVSSYPGRGAFHRGIGPAATPAASGPSVPMLGGDPARTGVQPGPGPSGSPVTLWHVTYDPLLGSPAVVGGVVYVSTLQGLMALDAATGTLKWRTPILDGTYSSPAVADGIVYVGSYTGPRTPGGTGFLLAYDAATGTELWRTHVGDPESSAPAVVNGMVFIAGSEQGTATLYAVDARSGKERWHSSLGEDQCACTGFSPAVAGGVVYVGSDHGTLYAFDTNTGKERWHAETGGYEMSTPSVADGAVFISVAQNGGNQTSQAILYAAFDAADGHVRWASSVLVPITSPNPFPLGVAVANGMVYEIGPDQTGIGVRAVDTATGKPIWMTHDLGGTPSTAPVFADGVVYVGGETALDAKSGDVLWQYGLGGRPSAAPAVVHGRIYVGTLEGNLSALTSSPPSPPPFSVIVQAGTPTSQLIPAQMCPGPVGRTSSDQAVPGTPAASFVGGRAPFSGIYFDRNALPPGGPVSRLTVEAIGVTIAQMEECAAKQGTDMARAFYSTDYLRRFDGAPVASAFWYGIYGERLSLDDARQFGDGRVGILVSGVGTNPLFIIFIQQEGRWLIDEIYPTLPPNGTPPVIPTQGGIG